MRIKSLVLTILILVPGCTSDPQQAKSFKTLFDHYREKEYIEAISFPPGLAGIFLDDSNPEQAELKKLMQELSSFRMLSVKGGSEDSDQVAEVRETVMDFSSRQEFQDVFRMQSEGQDIFLRILEKDDMVREAILMLEVDESFFVIDLRGNISLELFTKLVEGGYLDDLTSLSEFNF